ncbi:MAG: hypothetical protein M1839_003489 [Geoglossum umbratile]|nr:MAG: hypothetical protein M1839_003489 [Geoglossum umbratile]
MQPKSAILYANPTKTTFLLDIPASISLAANPNSTLLSSTPPSQPYALPEPKTAAARARVLSSYNEDEEILEYEEGVRRDLEEALREVERNWEGEWCVERIVSRAGKEDMTLEGEPETEFDFQTYAQNLATLSHFLPSTQETPPLALPLPPTPPLDLSDIYNLTLANPNPTPTTLTLHSPTKTPHNFTIPPFSTFTLAHVTPTSATPFPTTKFTLILLDPPWPNRSARRHGRYTTSPNTSSIKQLLYSLPSKLPLAQTGTVAVWTTNKPAHRALILDEQTGLFARWGVQPSEEWIWLKTTPTGQPIFPLSSLWRKPYETLLIGRRPPAAPQGPGPKRRILISVPDLHSRKPHLGEMLAEAGFVAECGSVLEVFGRCLTRGWWAWGDEVVRGNWVGCWVEDEGRGEKGSQFLL